MKKLGIGLLVFTLIGIIGGVIYALSEGEDMMVIGVTGGIMGIIIGLPLIGIIKFFGFLCGRSGGSSSSSSSYGSSSGSIDDYVKRKMNNPHTCDTCAEYSHTSGKCKSSGDSKSPGNSCSNWR